MGPLLVSGISYTSWICDNSQNKQWDVITHPYSNFNGGLNKPPLKLEHGWVITSHLKQWMWLLISGLIWITVSKMGSGMQNMWRPIRADFRLAPCQWETSLQSNAVSHWLGANLESALPIYVYGTNMIFLPLMVLYTSELYKIFSTINCHFFLGYHNTDLISILFSAANLILKFCISFPVFPRQHRSHTDVGTVLSGRNLKMIYAMKLTRRLLCTLYGENKLL